MTAYIEIVILDNFLVTYSISTLTYRLLLKRRSRLRALMAATLGTGVALAYPFVKHAALLWTIKIALWAALGFILFFKKEKLFAGSLLFLGLTFAFGGAAFCLNFLVCGSAERAMRASMFDFPVSLVVAAVLISAAAARKLGTRIRKKRDISEAKCECSLTLFGKKIELRALMDTGNRLFDDVTGLPVAVVAARSIMAALSDESVALLVSGRGERIQRGAHYEQISTVGGGSRKILILRPDEFVLYSGGRKNILDNVAVGVSFSPLRDADDYDVIVHPSLL